VSDVRAERASIVDAYLLASSVPMRGGHTTGTLDEARALLALHPALPTSSLFAAAVSGNAAAVYDRLSRDPSLVSARGGPHDWDALTWCCFSRWLRDDRARAGDFVHTARVLLDAGASANTGFYDRSHAPEPQHESVLYGAAGVAFCAPLTELLLSYGANPNDSEVPYHAAEQYAADVVAALLAAPTALTPDSLATMLLRKADWHDHEGVVQLLQHGVDPNVSGPWPRTAFMQALLRDNDLAIVEAMFEAGGDPHCTVNGQSALSLAAWHGRTDVLQLFAERGVELPQQGVDAVAVDATLGDFQGVRARLAASGHDRETFMARLPAFVARCAGNGALAPMGVLLQLVPTVDVRWAEGDGYWDIAPDSTALHVAAWRAQHGVVRQLVEAGADVNATDGRGRTPLMRAVDACVRSYWQDRRRPTSVDVLLKAGARRDGVALPTGYDAIDLLLRRGSD
jgi:ankyrin repeat protein